MKNSQLLRQSTNLLMAIFLLAVSFAAFPAKPASAATGTICEKFGSTAQGNYIVMNNKWGTDATQCINVTNNGFQIIQQDGVASFNGAPVSYPAIYAGCHYNSCSPNTNLPMKISEIGSAMGNVTVSYPGSGVYDAAYDIWLNADTNVSGVQDTEIMIWLNHTGTIQPIGSQTGSFNALGRTWAVWTGWNGGNNVVSYVTEGMTTLSGDIRPFLLDAVTRGAGYGDTSWYLTSVQMGFEPWQGGVGLSVNSFSLDVVRGTAATSTPVAPTPCTGCGSNLALNKPATSSSNESTSYAPNLAVDGNGTTRWASAFSDPQWIQVDLGSSKAINRVILNWEAAYGKDFQIQVSDNATSWTTIKTVTGNTSQSNDLVVSGNGRYVRMYGTARATQYGYSLYEFNIYGSDATATTVPATAVPTTAVPTATTPAVTPSTCGTSNILLGKPATSSSNESASYTPNLAVDGNGTTRWASAFANDQWLQIDLGAVYNLCKVNLKWEAAYASAFNIQVSNDASTWTTIKTILGNTSLNNSYTVNGSGRYLRIYGVTRATQYGFSLFEVEAFIQGTVIPTTIPPSATPITVTPSNTPSIPTATSTTVPPTATPTSTGPAACVVTYTIADSWGNGYNANVTINNNGAAINGWTLTWSFPGDQRINSSWNGTATQNGQNVSAVNASYNGSIATGASATLGISVNYTSNNTLPVNFAVNGVACNGNGPVPTTVPPTAVPPTSVPPTSIPPVTPVGGFLDNMDGPSALFSKADGWSNGGFFNAGWRADHVTFANGLMNITVDNNTCPSGCSSKPYAAGEYRTNNFYGYGRYETRMKPAKYSGAMTGSLFTYTGPSDGKPWDEIDIEFLGKDLTKMQTNYFTNGAGGHETIVNLGFDASAAFHTYAFEWTASSIKWYVDGNLVVTENGSRGPLPTNPGKIMLNAWPGTGVDGWLGWFNYTGAFQAQYDWVKFTPLP